MGSDALLSLHVLHQFQLCLDDALGGSEENIELVGFGRVVLGTVGDKVARQLLKLNDFLGSVGQ